MGCFKALARAWVEFLQKQQLKATIWAKLPPDSDILAAIAQYEQAGLAEQVYLCQIGQTTAKLAPPAPPMTPIFLEASTQLRQEYFLLVLSPQFCGLLLARQETQDAPPIPQNQPSCAKIAYSFAPPAIEAALRGIQQAIAPNDTTPAEILTDSPIPFPLPAFPEAKLLDCLLHKHIEVGESVELASIEAAKRQPPDFASPEFFKNLARELTTVLTSQKMALRLLEAQQNKREQRERYLQFVQRECNLQNSLLVGLQELMEIQESAASLQLSSNLEDVIPTSVSTYQPLAAERDIILGYTVPAELPTVICPDNWLQRILQHLLDNSLKFTPAKGHVQVRAAQKQEWVELTVADTGVGIEPRDLPKVFDSFYRGRNAISEETIGAGLGLTAVRQMVELCGGTIEIASQLAKGTVVTVRLPLAS
jgi:signal transduction histidine kinase